MAHWPNIVGPSALSGAVKKPLTKIEFEAGYTQSRPRATRSIERVSLGFDSMPKADLDQLLAFFEQQQGGAFSWTDPRTGTDKTMHFIVDEIPFQYISPGRYSVTLEMEEA
ncbi:phage tail protein [Desulfobaculum bizertense]|uniref:phage tail protein n=1 Tax=Desulfobaculum bizertense TaxID=376490 RepID=UPI001F21BD29|nr:phage tail protein [Desulfobaculum bizertense]UIJ36896.1 phage tail protein [Desulfobaculum bizertense]